MWHYHALNCFCLEAISDLSGSPGNSFVLGSVEVSLRPRRSLIRTYHSGLPPPLKGSTMQYTAKVVDVIKQRSQCLIVACYEGGALSPSASAISAADARNLEQLLKRENFQGKAGQTLLLLNTQGIAAERLLLVGLGPQMQDGSVTADNFRKAVEKSTEALKATPCSNLVICFGEVSVSGKDVAWQARQVAEALETASYRFDRFKSKPAEVSFVPEKIIFAVDKKQVNAANQGLHLGKSIATGVNLARELGNLPGNICTPTYLASEAKRLARGQTALSVKVLEEKQMKELGMGSLLSVSAGSDQPAKLIVLEYTGGAKKEAPIALVGKGITRSE